MESGQTKPRGPHEVPGRAWGVARPGALWALGGPPPVGLGSSIFYLFHKKSPKSFIQFQELLFLHKKQQHGNSAENSVSQG